MSLLLPQRWAPVSALFLLSSLSLSAQNTVQTHALGNGAVSTANAEMRLDGTFGLSIIGTATTSPHRLEQGFWFARNVSSSTTDAVAGDALPQLYCAPNPISRTATIQAYISETGYVQLALYDLLGREIRLLADGIKTQGSIEAQLDSRELPAGEYRLILHSAEQHCSIPVRIVR